MGKLKKYKIISGIISILSIISIFFAIYAIYLLTGIETFYRTMVSLLLILATITIVYSLIESIKFYKKKKFIISIVLSFILMIIGIAISFIIFSVYLKISNTNEKGVIYKTALISLEKQESIENIKSLKIGMVEDKEDIEGYILPNEIINKNRLKENNEIIEYSDVITLMSALINKDVDAIFISANYREMLMNIEGFKGDTEVFEITSLEGEYEQTKDNENTEPVQERLTKPFTVLLLGVDSQQDGLKAGASFNGDTIILITFDPQTLHATMFSIPRDTYVTMACGGNITKINHAAWGGTKCMVKTVENFTGIKIDYYAKINFKGVVDLVNTLGGITVDVPVKFCESNSDRLIGPEYEICLDKGVQNLNGEQALALARHRKTLPLGDFQRGQHQQLVVEGMINKIKTLRSPNDFYNVLNTVSKNIETSMSTDEILSFYNIGKSILMKDDDANINITKTFLTGYDLYVYEGRSYSYTFQYYKQSLDSIVKAMKINLGLLPQEEIKTFSFSIKEPYEKTIIGKKYYSEARKTLIPNFTTYSVAGAQVWGSSNGFTINLNYIDSSNSAYYDGQIIGQSVHEGVLTTKAPKTITIDVVKKVAGGNVTPIEPTNPTTPSTPEEPNVPENPSNPDDNEPNNKPSTPGEENNNTGDNNTENNTEGNE